MTKISNLQIRKWHVACGLLFICIFGALWFVPPIWQLHKGPVTVTRWDRLKGEIRVDVGPSKPHWISIRSSSRHVLNAIIVAEDARFFQHGGIDFLELAKSIETNIRKGRYARGASTITQQVIKMSFLTRDKTLIRKAREALGAMLVEKALKKNEILEWYINLAEFGDGVYGIKDAAAHYFSTKPELLTIQQAIHLALVLPSPNGWSKGLRQRDLTEFGHQRFATIATRMRINGYITDLQWQNVMVTGNFGNPIAGSESYAQYSDQAADDNLRDWLNREDELMTHMDVGPGFMGQDQVSVPDETAQSSQPTTSLSSTAAAADGSSKEDTEANHE